MVRQGCSFQEPQLVAVAPVGALGMVALVVVIVVAVALT